MVKTEGDYIFEETRAHLRTDVKLTRIILITFFIVSALLKASFGLPVSLAVLGLIAFWFLLYILYGYLIPRQKNTEGLQKLCFVYNVGDILLMTIIVHYLGGAEWIGGVFYLLTLSPASLILSQKKIFSLTLITILCYTSLVLLEYFQIIPHNALFSLRPGLYRETVFIFPQIIALATFFLFLGQNTRIFADEIKKEQKKLMEEREKVHRAYKEIEEARTILEIRVEARTKELQEVVNRQEETIAERTKELQRKIKELETLNRIAIGRELKMVELKKEIQRLKGER